MLVSQDGERTAEGGVELVRYINVSVHPARHGLASRNNGAV